MFHFIKLLKRKFMATSLLSGLLWVSSTLSTTITTITTITITPIQTPTPTWTPMEGGGETWGCSPLPWRRTSRRPFRNCRTSPRFLTQVSWGPSPQANLVVTTLSARGALCLQINEEQINVLHINRTFLKSIFYLATKVLNNYFVQSR